MARHAEASGVEMTIESFAGAISMKIKDDGKGFAVGGKARVQKNTGRGLLGMRERVEMIGGKFCVESAVGGPTTIHVEIPAAKSRVSLHSRETV